MAEQLHMFDGRPPLRQVGARKKRKPRADRPSIQVRFETFHAENPQVFDAMLALARGHIAKGSRRIGVKALWESLREYLHVTKIGTYKLDNSLTALYARKLIETDPSLASVIETRRRKAT